ncbi:MAG TPA: hypothetical protein VK773_04915 [Acidimicrobiales bacterium]|jgi:hypothetical protein|nr:hypothetical protein [Acidimicrobiales bacterium]
MAAPPDVIDRVLAWTRVDFTPKHRQPQWWRLALATVLAVGLSLAACAALVVIGEHVWPATKGFGHFQFADYGKLTVVGVLIACAGWPIVTRISSAPRWLFFRLAILVTLVLWLPDVWIWLKGESAQGVAVLMIMHLAIAVITYNVLVRVAPVQASRLGRGARATSEVAAS